MDTTAEVDETFHVTVNVVHQHTYRVTRLQDGVTSEQEAAEYIRDCDFETLDEREIHADTVSTEIIGSERTDG